MDIYIPLKLFSVGLKSFSILDILIFRIELYPHGDIAILLVSKIMLDVEGSFWRRDRLLIELPLRFGEHDLKLVHHIGKHDHLKNEGDAASESSIVSYVSLIRERDFLSENIELSEIFVDLSHIAWVSELARIRS